jgi:hypothetical protein
MPIDDRAASRPENRDRPDFPPTFQQIGGRFSGRLPCGNLWAVMCCRAGGANALIAIWQHGRDQGKAMQETLVRADGALIDKVYQPLVDWIDQQIAIDCSRLARLCIDLSALAWILSQAGGAVAAVGTGSLAVEMLQFGLIVLGLGAIMVLRTVFEHTGGARGGRQAGRANPLRAAMQTHRLGCLLWLGGLLARTVAAQMAFGSLTLLAVGVLTTTAVYVAACSNPPPQQREHKVEHWGRRLAALRSG